MLPFTVDQFFSVLAAYNKAIWPAQIVAYLLEVAALGVMGAAYPWTGRMVAAILSVLWVWNGLAYHLAFFTSINPAAHDFAALFVIQGLLFFACGRAAGRLGFAGPFDRQRALGIVLIAYSSIIYRRWATHRGTLGQMRQCSGSPRARPRYSLLAC